MISDDALPLTDVSPGQAAKRPGRQIRVLLVDDHPFVRDGLAGLLNSRPEYEIVGEAGTAGEAIGKLRMLRPNLIIVDLRLPDMDGTKVLTAARELRWGTFVIVLSAFRSDDDLLAAARAGAAAYLLKTEAGEKVLDAIQRVIAGENILKKEISSSLHEQSLHKGLTDRELAILALLGRGMTNKEICATAKLSENTVKTHLRRIFDKIGVTNRAEAAAIALRRGLVT